MTRVKTLLVLLLAFSSVCFGATLMHITVNALTSKKSDMPETSSCEIMVRNHEQSGSKNIAKDLYQEAFTLSMNGHPKEALEKSKCASSLINGTDHWRIENSSFINN